MSIVVDFSDEVGVYPLPDLSIHGRANDFVAGVPVAVVLDPGTPDRWHVFHRRLGGQLLTLAVVDGAIVDNETRTIWDRPTTGG